MEQREVKWCNTHDIPWASHVDLGVVLTGCEPGKRYMVTNVETEQIVDSAEPNPNPLDKFREAFKEGGPEDLIITDKMPTPTMGQLNKPVPQLSSSGHWAKGQEYVPDSGECAGHTVEVINPRLQALRKVTFERDNEHRTLTGLIECVQVRCTKCFRSWRFPAAAELLGVDEIPSQEYQTNLARRIFDEIVGNGGLDELAE